MMVFSIANNGLSSGFNRLDARSHQGRLRQCARPEERAPMPLHRGSARGRRSDKRHRWLHFGERLIRRSGVVFRRSARQHTTTKVGLLKGRRRKLAASPPARRNRPECRRINVGVCGNNATEERPRQAHDSWPILPAPTRPSVRTGQAVPHEVDVRSFHRPARTSLSFSNKRPAKAKSKRHRCNGYRTAHGNRRVGYNDALGGHRFDIDRIEADAVARNDPAAAVIPTGSRCSRHATAD